MNNFWTGFIKRAADLVDPVTKLLKWNAEGGVDPRDPNDMASAQNADLITLPKDIAGGNCSNCIHFRMIDEKAGSGFCTNPDVKQDVTMRMVCSFWDAPGAYRSWENIDPATAEVLEGQAQQQAAGEEQEDAAAEQALASGQAQATPPAKAEKKPAEKKKKPEDKGHTINVNVGGEKKK
jgi:hypothetical protein